LSPLGALHEEPARLLRDDLRDTAQAATLLGLLGQGCHRPSEFAGRLALAAGRRVVLGLWLRQPQRADADVAVYGPDDVLRVLS